MFRAMVRPPHHLKSYLHKRTYTMSQSDLTRASVKKVIIDISETDSSSAVASVNSQSLPPAKDVAIAPVQKEKSPAKAPAPAAKPARPMVRVKKPIQLPKPATVDPTHKKHLLDAAKTVGSEFVTELAAAKRPLADAVVEQAIDEFRESADGIVQKVETTDWLKETLRSAYPSVIRRMRKQGISADDVGRYTRQLRETTRINGSDLLTYTKAANADKNYQYYLDMLKKLGLQNHHPISITLARRQQLSVEQEAAVKKREAETKEKYKHFVAFSPAGAMKELKDRLAGEAYADNVKGVAVPTLTAPILADNSSKNEAKSKKRLRKDFEVSAQAIATQFGESLAVIQPPINHTVAKGAVDSLRNVKAKIVASTQHKDAAKDYERKARIKHAFSRAVKKMEEEGKSHEEVAKFVKYMKTGLKHVVRNGSDHDFIASTTNAYVMQKNHEDIIKELNLEDILTVEVVGKGRWTKQERAQAAEAEGVKDRVYEYGVRHQPPGAWKKLVQSALSPDQRIWVSYHKAKETIELNQFDEKAKKGLADNTTFTKYNEFSKYANADHNGVLVSNAVISCKELVNFFKKLKLDKYFTVEYCRTGAGDDHHGYIRVVQINKMQRLFELRRISVIEHQSAYRGMKRQAALFKAGGVASSTSATSSHAHTVASLKQR